MRGHGRSFLVLLTSAAVSTLGVAQTPIRRTIPGVPRDTFIAWMVRLSNTGRWGGQDQLGTLNLITPAKRRAAAQSVRDGVSVSLASDLVAGPDSNAIRPMRFGLGVSRFDSTTSAAIDSITLLAHGYVYSHIDALSHFLFHDAMYNGFRRDQLTPEGAAKRGVEVMQTGIVTRGVLVDIPRVRAVPYLAAGDAVMPEDLELWESAWVCASRLETSF